MKDACEQPTGGTKKGNRGGKKKSTRNPQPSGHFVLHFVLHFILCTHTSIGQWYLIRYWTEDEGENVAPETKTMKLRKRKKQNLAVESSDSDSIEPSDPPVIRGVGSSTQAWQQELGP